MDKLTEDYKYFLFAQVLSMKTSQDKLELIKNLMKLQDITDEDDLHFIQNLLVSSAGHYLNKNTLLEIILGYQFDVNRQGDKACSPLSLAAKLNDVESMRLLINHAANIWQPSTYPNEMTGYQPLHYAAAGGYDSIVEKLIKAGADVNAKDLAGRTPLDVAITRKVLPVRLHSKIQENHLGVVSY